MAENPLPPLPLSGRTVLVVEDSSVQRAHAVATVAELGAARVLEAAEGREGLERLAGHPGIDLVLTDLEMPVMDGITFIGEFAARGFRPQVVVLSSQEPGVIHATGLMAETYGLEVPGVLAKPLRADGLRALLQAHPPRRAGAEPSDPPRGALAQAPTPADIAEGVGRGEFICHFQPQVTLQGALFKGVEALVRWRHPSLGLLGPAAFLPQAESSVEVMGRLTLAVLEAAAGQWHGWRRKGLTLEVSVNLSALSISTPGFTDLLVAAAERLDLPAKYLVFELTESASVSDLGHTLANLARLRMKGFKLSIDDFGTGFATFEQVERIPFTELKLDRSIVKHLPGSERHLVVAESLLTLTRGLKLAAVAEGIETLATWTCLRGLGCERGQGYFIARPMPGEQVPDWARLERTHLR